MSFILPNKEPPKKNKLTQAILAGTDLLGELTKPEEIESFSDVLHPSFNPQEKQLAAERLTSKEKLQHDIEKSNLAAELATAKQQSVISKDNRKLQDEARAMDNSGRRLTEAADRMSKYVGDTSNKFSGYLRSKLGLPESFGNMSDELMQKEVADILGLKLLMNYPRGRILLAEIQTQIKALPHATNSPEVKKRLVQALGRAGKEARLAFKSMESTLDEYGEADPRLSIHWQNEFNRELDKYHETLLAPSKKKVPAMTEESGPEPSGPEESSPEPPPPSYLSRVGSDISNIITPEQSEKSISLASNLADFFQGNKMSEDQRSEFISDLLYENPTVTFSGFLDAIGRTARTAFRSAAHVLPKSYRDELITETLNDDPGFIESTAENLIVMAATGGTSFIGALSAVLPPALKEATDNKTVQFAGALAPIFLAAALNPRSGAKFASNALNAVKSSIPETAIESGSLNALKTQTAKLLRKPGLSAKFNAPELLGDIETSLRNSKSVHDLINTRELLNKKYPLLAKDAMARNAYHQLAADIDKAIFSSNVPESVLSEYKFARDTAGVALEAQIKHNWLTNKLEDVPASIKTVAGYGMLHAMFQIPVIGPAAAITSGAGFMILGAMAAKNVFKQMAKDPALRKHYIQMFKELAKDNFPGLLRQANKLSESQVAQPASEDAGDIIY